MSNGENTLVKFKTDEVTSTKGDSISVLEEEKILEQGLASIKINDKKLDETNGTISFKFKQTRRSQEEIEKVNIASKMRNSIDTLMYKIQSSDLTKQEVIDNLAQEFERNNLIFDESRLQELREFAKIHVTLKSESSSYRDDFQRIGLVYKSLVDIRNIELGNEPLVTELIVRLDKNRIGIRNDIFKTPEMYFESCQKSSHVGYKLSNKYSLDNQKEKGLIEYSITVDSNAESLDISYTRLLLKSPEADHTLEQENSIDQEVNQI